MKKGSFIFGVIVGLGLLALLGQSWQSARVGWDYSGFDAAGVLETPTKAEYAVIPKGGTLADAIATYEVDLSTVGAPTEVGEYRADLLDFSDIKDGSYYLGVRIFDAADNSSSWEFTQISKIGPDKIQYPQIVDFSGSNGVLKVSGTFTIEENDR